MRTIQEITHAVIERKWCENMLERLKECRKAQEQTIQECQDRIGAITVFEKVLEWRVKHDNRL